MTVHVLDKKQRVAEHEPSILNSTEICELHNAFAVIISPVTPLLVYLSNRF